MVDYQSVYSDVTKELVSLAFKKNYPIHPFLALMSLKDAFLELDIYLTPDNSSRNADIRCIRYVNKKRKLFRAEMSYEQLLKGKGDRSPNPPCAVSSLEDSIESIYKKMGEGALLSFGERLDWWSIQKREIPHVNEFLGENIKHYLMEYQENALVSRLGKVPELREPKIFQSLIRNEPSFRPSDFYDFNEKVSAVRDNPQISEYIAPYSDSPPKKTKREFSDEEQFLAFYFDMLAIDKEYLFVDKYSLLCNKARRISLILSKGVDSFEEAGHYVWTNQGKCFL